MEPDFEGWATKAGLKCSDGRTIMKDAFKHQDQVTVPLVWQHMIDTPENILGHAVLHNRPLGVWTEAFFNETTAGQTAKEIVKHKDVTFLSIFANNLVEKAKEVLHGNIREVSLVVAGANPGAKIETVHLRHSDGSEDELVDEAIITTGESVMVHADGDDSGDDSKETYEDILATLSDKQRDVVLHMLNEALQADPNDLEHSDKGDDEAEDDANQNDSDEDNSDDDNSSDDATVDESTNDADTNAGDDNSEGDLEHQEGTDMNVFDQDGGTTTEKRPTLTHAQLTTIVADAKKPGMTLKESFLAHADEYGITNIELLFPDAKAVDSTPELITRQQEWVAKVLNGTKKLPYSKIKSLSADVTHEEARAKGYVKGDLKKNEFFALAKRETGPKTIYKKQQLDRDDIIDITDLDVVTWLWAEMRLMLNEEIARAILIGDGREVDDPDKIDETKIRPIAHDHEFYTDVLEVPANVGPEALVEAVIRGRENYKGSGNPTAFMTQKVMNDMLLTKDRMNRRLYRNRAELAAELEVESIVLVPVMEGHQTDNGELLMVLVNLSDYSVGTTKGGQISTFEDFNLDYNQHRYLIEGRMSGALTKHKTAQVVVRANGTLVDPDVPTFNAATGVVTIPNETGVVYKNAETDATLAAGAQNALAAGASVTVKAVPAAGYFFPHGIDTDWDFTRNA